MSDQKTAEQLRVTNRAIAITRDYWYGRAMEAEGELAQARKEAQAQSAEVQSCWLSPVEEAEGLKRQLIDACAARDALARECNQLEEGREYNASLVLERDRELARARANLSVVKKRAKTLYEIGHDCNKNLTQALNERDEAESELGLTRQAVQEQDIELAQARVMLSEAEAALVNCGIGGIYAEFDGLADAIEQMAQHIKEIGTKLENTGLALYIREKSLDECTQTMHTERQLRREAEERAGDAKILAEARRCQLEAWDQRLDRAEALAQLVTLELAALLERLGKEAKLSHEVAGDAGDSHMPWAMQLYWDAKDALTIAAQIREALDA